MSSYLPTPAQLAEARAALASAMEGTGPPVEFTADGATLLRPDATNPALGGHPDTVAVVRTSGSTGTPKQTLLTAAALRASAVATAARTGGSGQWLLAVGLQFVAGLAVLSRSIMAGTTPGLMPPGPFTSAGFVSATANLPARVSGTATAFRAVSLVPTMLARLLSTEQSDAVLESALQALHSYDAVLVGGARLPEETRALVADAGLHNLHLTYGMTETCGGCVYNGVPLEGVHVDTVTLNDDVPRLRIAGPMVTVGYLDSPELTNAHFSKTEFGPAYLTEDTVAVTLSPTSLTPFVTVTGRVDDVINTGGLKISAGAVTEVLETVPGVRQVAVGSAPDIEWGQAVCAAIVLDSTGTWNENLARDTIRRQLGAAAIPKTWLYCDALPLLPNGKTDRQALATQFSAHHR